MKIYHYGEDLTVYVFKAIMDDGTNCMLVVDADREHGTVEPRILFNWEIDWLDDEDIYWKNHFEYNEWESDWEDLECLSVLEDFDGNLEVPEKYSIFMARYAW